MSLKGNIIDKKNIIIRKLVIILIWLIVWHLLAKWVDNAILLATPIETIQAFMKLLPKIQFWQSVTGSLIRISAGFLLGFTAAVCLGVLSSRFHVLEEFLSPVMSLFKAVPVASFVVLFLIWWGSSFLAVAICFLIVLPNVYINTLAGIKNADKQLLELAEVFRMPLKNRIFYIYRPALKPFLLSSLKISLGMSWKSGVAAEVIGNSDFSIGGQIYLSKIYLDTAGLFAWTAVVILLSFCFEKLMLWMAGRFFAWEPACRKQHIGRSQHHKQFDTEHQSEKMGAKQTKHQTLCCKKLYKAYGEKRVIQDFSTVYESGETYYLTNPSGSGKTTLLRLLCGLEKPDSGEVAAKKDTLKDDTPFYFSMVFQEDRLCMDYSAVRNVEMVTGDRKRAAEALSLLLEKEALNKPCSQLSGGMKRRVALVRAMEAESDCVLLDEPFAGMDAMTKDKAEAYITERQQGRILIIATHIS